ncbi:MAG: hypothetical protein ACYCQJ_13805 [Nitrososphaerales archaeon]
MSLIGTEYHVSLTLKAINDAGRKGEGIIKKHLDLTQEMIENCVQKFFDAEIHDLNLEADRCRLHLEVRDHPDNIRTLEGLDTYLKNFFSNLQVLDIPRQYPGNLYHLETELISVTRV